jgi:hypothetical protein
MSVSVTTKHSGTLLQYVLSVSVYRVFLKHSDTLVSQVFSSTECHG